MRQYLLIEGLNFNIIMVLFFRRILFNLAVGDNKIIVAN